MHSGQVGLCVGRGQKDCLLLKGVVPPSLSLSAFLAVWASCRSNCNALCVMGTSFVRDSGQEVWVCPYSSFPIGFFPSWIFLGGEITVFLHQQRQERCKAACHAALLFQPFFHSSLAPPSPHCHSVCPQLVQSRVMLGPPHPWPCCFPCH